MLTAMEHLEYTAQLRYRVRVVVHTQVAVGVFLRMDDMDASRLAAAAIAACLLTGRQGAKEPLRKGFIIAGLEGVAHRLGHILAHQNVAEADVASALQRTCPGDTLVAGVGGRVSIAIDDRHLAEIAAAVALDQPFQGARRGQPLLQQR